MGRVEGMKSSQLDSNPMGRDELCDEYYDEDDMWLSDDDWDEREPPSEGTLSKLRESFHRMSDDAKLKLVMTLAELSDDEELLDLMGACIDDSQGIDTSDVRERAWSAVRNGLSASDRERSRGVNIDGLPELTAMNIGEALAREFDRTVWDLADNLRVSDACDVLEAIAEALESFPDDVSDVYRKAISIEVEDLRDNVGNRSPRYAFL